MQDAQLGGVGEPARRRREVSDSGQQPFAIILSCSDSRVPPEIIFDQGLGDVFVIRVFSTWKNGPLKDTAGSINLYF